MFCGLLYEGGVGWGMELAYAKFNNSLSNSLLQEQMKLVEIREKDSKAFPALPVRCTTT